MTEGRDPKIVEREKQLFAGLMRTKTLPMVPDHTPSDIPVELDDPNAEETEEQSIEAEKLSRLRVRQRFAAEVQTSTSSKPRKPAE